MSMSPPETIKVGCNDVSRLDIRLNAKQEAIAVIGRLPDATELSEIVYRLHVLDKIRQGLQDMEQECWITSERWRTR